jgi:ATP:ADP antiporter, AAA family
MLCAGTVTAQFIAGKATRDALYLANLDVTSLPAMVMATAVLSIGLVVLSGRCLRRVAPPRFVSLAFIISALLLVAEWVLVGLAPRVAAAIVYLQISGVGPMLGSGFWLIATERFDPHTAKKRFGQIAGVGTLGGLIGGVLAERIASSFGVAAMLPALAVLNLVAAWQIRRLGAPLPANRAGERAAGTPVMTPPPERALDAAPELAAEGALSGFRVLAEAPYLRNLAALVLLSTFSAALIDYVFKAQAVATLGRGDGLLRFFAIYYAGTSLITFVLQTSMSRLALEKLGLAVSAGTPSLALFTGGLGMLLAPGFEGATAARAGESVFRGSLFRAGYELFYTPIAVREKRAAKSLIDVGVDRFGDALGGGVVQMILLLAPAAQFNIILFATLACSGAAMAVASRLNRGYVRTLERSLLNRAVELDLSEVEDLTTRTVMLRTLHGGLPTAERAAVPVPRAAAMPEGIDPEVQEILALRSRDRDRIVPVLRHDDGVPPSLVPHVIPLLAWDPVSQDAIHALRKVAEERVGELLDALLDPNQPFAVRRRLARVFSVCVSQRAADGLLLGLDDQRFEVRFHCGRSLAAIVEKNPRIRIDAERVYSVVLREVAVGRSIWASHRLLDRAEDPDQRSFVDEFVKGRTSQGLGHVFTLLALVLPAESLQAAFRALHSDDDTIRGTALEYLDGVLPPTIRARLWPSLEQLQELTRRTAKADTWQAM